MSTKTRSSHSARSSRAFYWMVIPAMILFVGFNTIPALTGLFYSFTNYSGYGQWDFVGVRNYMGLFEDPLVLRAYIFTFSLSILATIIVNVIALGIALALSANIAWRNAFRGIFFIPYVLAVLVVGYVFKFIFSNVLPSMGFGESILVNPQWAWVAVLVVTVWQGAALNIVIYLSGLQTVPTEVYEAAALDGAGTWRRFRSITFPLIAPFFTINMVLALRGFLQMFDQIIALTNGGPGHSTQSIAMLIFRGGFQGGEYGYQMANAVVYFIAIVLVSLLQFRIISRREATV